MDKPKMKLEEVCQDMRRHGMKLSTKSLADGIEAGVFPFGTVISKSEKGIRNIIIMRRDYLAWAKDYLEVEA